MIRPALVLLSLLVAPTAAPAQGVAGQWQCSFSNRGRDMSGTWQYQYALALYPNGTFQAQGSYTAMSAGFAVPFQAQGRWQAGQGGVMLRGMAMKQGGLIQFGPMFQNVQARAMSFQANLPGGQLTSYCQR